MTTISSTHMDYRGLKFDVRIVHDHDHESPWESSDGHGVVTDWIDTSDEQRDADGIDYHDTNLYRALGHDHGSTRYYDWSESLKIAKRDQWGLADAELTALQIKLKRLPTKKEIREEAVRLDYEFLRGWCQDEWSYVGVVVNLLGTNLEASLWGIEGNADAYHEEVAKELAEEIIATGKPELQKQIAELQETLEVLKAAIP